MRDCAALHLRGLAACAACPYPPRPPLSPAPFPHCAPQLQDVFDPLVTLLTPDSAATALEGDDMNRSIPGEGGQLQFSFLGTKGPTGAPAALVLMLVPWQCSARWGAAVGAARGAAGL